MALILDNTPEVSTLSDLPKYNNYIDGSIAPPASGDYLPMENVYCNAAGPDRA